MGPPEIVVLLVCEFAQLNSFLLGLVEVVVYTLESGVVILALPLFDRNGVSESVDFVLVLGLLLPEFGQLVLEVVGVLPELVDGVALLTEVSLESNALLLPPADLVSNGSDFSLVLVVRSVLLVGEESQVLDLLAEVVQSHHVLVVTVVVVIVLHEFLVLQVSVLLLDGVQLVPQSQIVLVSLLDLEDLRLQLRNKQVLLVAGQVH